MNLILFMVSLALTLSISFVVIYIWALSGGQFDDLDTPARRMLKDDLNILKNKEEGLTHE
ncbi:MAG: cbb3-type cytochrome oxidase assembly protein CcoS [Pseudobdellovibrio sp.]